jgi:hypothetical protein
MFPFFFLVFFPADCWIRKKVLIRWLQQSYSTTLFCVWTFFRLRFFSFFFFFFSEPFCGRAPSRSWLIVPTDDRDAWSGNSTRDLPVGAAYVTLAQPLYDNFFPCGDAQHWSSRLVHNHNNHNVTNDNWEVACCCCCCCCGGSHLKPWIFFSVWNKFDLRKLVPCRSHPTCLSVETGSISIHNRHLFFFFLSRLFCVSVSPYFPVFFSFLFLFVDRRMGGKFECSRTWWWWHSILLCVQQLFLLLLSVHRLFMSPAFEIVAITLLYG